MVNIAALGSPEMAAKIGKKGTVSDIAMFNYKGNGGAITFIHPLRYPERIQPLLYSVNLSHGSLFVVEEIDKYFGEQVIALDMRGIRHGIFFLKNYTIPEEIKNIVKGTSLASYEFMENEIDIREKLLKIKIEDAEGPTIIPVDHFFPVKGVGTVVLGTVMRGKVEVHQELQIYPYERTVIVKSIQVHDKDVKSAETGSRVGLALKGIKPDELDRGITLAEPGTMSTVMEFELNPEITPFWKGTLKDGMVLHFSSGTQFVSGRLMDRTVKLEKRMAYVPGEEILLIQADSMPRIIGKTRIKVI